MAQKEVWENEYKRPKLVTLGTAPRKDLKDFLKFLRKKKDVSIDELRVLDLGSGTGRNAHFLADLGSNVVGLDISETAIDIAQKRAKHADLEVEYLLKDIGKPYPFPDDSFDLVIDVMSSNSLNEEERTIYLKEVHRVLKKGGYFFVRGLCKDGDKNAKNLLKLNPGKEHDTYIVGGMNLVERVFCKDDFTELYSPYFTILELTKKTNYKKFDNQSYKCNYWLAYMQK